MSPEAIVIIVTGLISLIGLGVGLGINYGRITTVEQAIKDIKEAMSATIAARESMMVQVTVLQTQMTELMSKMVQLQSVVVETRNAVMLRKTDFVA